MSKSTGVGRHPPSQRTHGHSFVNGKPTPEYSAWASMKNRCLSPTSGGYRSYGGRGIKVCVRWIESFEAFLADVGRRPSQLHSLDRYPDNDGNYEPGNVRWATRKEQARNTRKVLVVEFEGEQVALPDLAERFGVPIELVRQRVSRGWSIARALT